MDAPLRFVTDGGLETDLIFNHGLDLPEFAAYPLVREERGRGLLRDYYAAYAEIARAAGTGLLLETPTWRANPDWGARLGDGPEELRAVNRDAACFLRDLRQELAGDVDQVRVIGMVGPQGDGYARSGVNDAEHSRAYHRPQLQALLEGGVDAVTAYTLTNTSEALGIVLAARDVGVPVAISFTVETDGKLPDGTVVADAITEVDRWAPPDYYLLNCAHPDHMAKALDGGRWQQRIAGLRPNASRRSHDELDQTEALDRGDPQELAHHTLELAAQLPSARILGGCCGTDADHVAAMWEQHTSE